MILVVVATWNTTCLPSASSTSEGCCLPYPATCHGGADDPRRTTVEARCRCCQVGHAMMTITRTTTRTTTRRLTTTIGSSALALMAFLACIAPPCRVVRSPPLSSSSIVIVVAPPPRCPGVSSYVSMNVSRIIIYISINPCSAKSYCTRTHTASMHVCSRHPFHDESDN